MPEATPDRSTSSAAGSCEQLLTFIVAGEEYGVDILRVQEIRSWSSPMPIPNTPHDINGVINIRGDVVAIADLRERLGLIVDDLLAQQQIVVKSLETNYGHVEGLSGATILGDGRVALILDVIGLGRMARRMRSELTFMAAE